MLLTRYNLMSDATRLIVCILHRLETNARIVGEGIDMRRTVADRINVRQGGSTLCVNLNAIAMPRTRIDERLNGGNNANANDNSIGFEATAICAHDTQTGIGFLNTFGRE